MWNTTRELLGPLSVLVLLVSVACSVTETGGAYGKKCNTTDLSASCGLYGRCVQIPGVEDATCKCIRNYYRVQDQCIPEPTTTTASSDDGAVTDAPKTESGGSSVAAGLLIPTFLILCGALAFFGARRYKWVQRLQQYRQTRYGNVLVTRDDDDDDDDDPPIA